MRQVEAGWVEEDGLSGVVSALEFGGEGVEGGADEVVWIAEDSACVVHVVCCGALGVPASDDGVGCEAAACGVPEVDE